MEHKKKQEKEARRSTVLVKHIERDNKKASTQK